MMGGVEAGSKLLSAIVPALHASRPAVRAKLKLMPQLAHRCLAEPGLSASHSKLFRIAARVDLERIPSVSKRRCLHLTVVAMLV